MVLHRITILLFFDVIFPDDIISYILWLCYIILTEKRIQFSGNGFHSLCLNDGVVYSTGSNSKYQLGTGNAINRDFFREIDIKDVIQVSNGIAHSVFLKKDGTIFGCGANDVGQLGLFDERLLDVYHDQDLLITIPRKLPINDVLSISCGNFHTIVQTKNGLFSTGNNDNYCLGHSIVYQSCYKFSQITISDVISFRCSLWTVFIQTKEGLFVHGNNRYAQLGLGDKRPRFLPTKIELDNVLSYYNGDRSSLILTSHGLFVCNGENISENDAHLLKPRLIDINLKINHFLIDDDDRMFFTTEIGLYYVYLKDIDNIIHSNDIKLVIESTILSITSSYDGVFIETIEKCYGIGTSKYGELGTRLSQIVYDTNPCKINFL